MSAVEVRDRVDRVERWRYRWFLAWLLASAAGGAGRLLGWNHGHPWFVDGTKTLFLVAGVAWAGCGWKGRRLRRRQQALHARAWQQQRLAEGLHTLVARRGQQAVLARAQQEQHLAGALHALITRRGTADPAEAADAGAPANSPLF